jgi:hypothetical protein
MATVKKRIRGQPETVEKLRARITEACNSITVRHLQNTRRNFQDRFGHCPAVEGKHRTIPLTISVNLLSYLCVNVFTFCFFFNK